MIYRSQFSGRALKQMPGLPESAFDALVDAMAEVVAYPDDPLGTFPTTAPYIRRAGFGSSGLITYMIDDGAEMVTIIDVTWAG